MSTSKSPNQSPSMPQSDTPKQYELNVSDLLQIPEESFGNFLIDLKKWHRAAQSTVNLLNTIAKAVGEPEVPTELTKLIWTDDGKHDSKVIIKADTKVTSKAQNQPQSDIRTSL